MVPAQGVAVRLLAGQPLVHQVDQRPAVVVPGNSPGRCEGRPYLPEPSGRESRTEWKWHAPLHLALGMNDNTIGDSVLSDDQRRAVFRKELGLTSETGAGRVVGRIPQKFVRGVLVAMVVLGGGGALVEHYFGNVGLPTSSPPTTFATPSTIPYLGTTTVPSVITASQAFIGLKFIGTANVPHFSLTDQHGATITPATSKGKVTLVASL